MLRNKAKKEKVDTVIQRDKAEGRLVHEITRIVSPEKPCLSPNWYCLLGY
jgi:hypothetical protein